MVLPIGLKCHGGQDPADYCQGPDLIEVWYINEGLEQQIGALTGSTNLGPLSNFLSFTSNVRVTGSIARMGRFIILRLARVLYTASVKKPYQASNNKPSLPQPLHRCP